MKLNGEQHANGKVNPGTSPPTGSGGTKDDPSSTGQRDSFPSSPGSVPEPGPIGGKKVGSTPN